VSIIQRVQANAALQAQREGSSLLKGALPGAASGALAGVLSGQTSAKQAARNLRAAGATGIVNRANGLVNTAVRSAGSTIGGVLSGDISPTDAFSAAQRSLADSFELQSAGRTVQSVLGLSPTPTPKANSTGSQPAPWTAAPLWGGLTLERYRELFVESAMMPHAWKNLWFVSISEQSPSLESPFGVPTMNLLALDVSFSPCTLPGEAVPIGGANMDKLTGTERVELRMTTLDDDQGSVKRWFIAKSDQAAGTDGTFGLPADYLVTVTIAQMDPLGELGTLQRMVHRWLMRTGNIDIELSRRAPELEELQLSFVQFDTFMKVP
jgi:hypothetical protein